MMMLVREVDFLILYIYINFLSRERRKKTYALY